MIEEKQKELNEHGDRMTHVVRYTVEPYYINFRIWRTVTDLSGAVLVEDDAAISTSYIELAPLGKEMAATPFVSGFLKWDGCVEVEFTSPRLHFCGPEKEPELGLLMTAIYALGPEIEHWDFR